MSIALSTEEKINALVAAGMQEITAEELEARIMALGYRFCSACSFNYMSRHNGRPYSARSVSYIDIESGLGYAHVQARRDARFEQLQALRNALFVFKGGRVWKL